ncbi:MAG: hypothetical protein FWD50_07975 [Betaproteobacteria bacterium]|nr:hypothetical protein [Betaproteobacteria bacterium]
MSQMPEGWGVDPARRGEGSLPVVTMRCAASIGVAEDLPGDTGLTLMRRAGDAAPQVRESGQGRPFFPCSGLVRGKPGIIRL